MYKVLRRFKDRQNKIRKKIVENDYLRGDSQDGLTRINNTLLTGRQAFTRKRRREHFRRKEHQVTELWREQRYTNTGKQIGTVGCTPSRSLQWVNILYAQKHFVRHHYGSDTKKSYKMDFFCLLPILTQKSIPQSRSNLS